jgi:dTDP-4-dehydrorhamnose reductase
LGALAALDRAQCDLADSVAIRRAVRRVAPDVIVNAAAYTAVDQAESESQLAHAVNGAAPGIVGEEAARLGALVLHYSTDYVFDGAQSAYYKETDAANPVNVYGASKLAGERALQASGARYLILRTSWVAGAHGVNFLKTMLRLAGQRSELKVVADQTGAPTSAALLAEVSAHLVRQACAGQRQGALRYGVYHLAAAGRTNWHEYACYVIERARAAGWPLTVAPQDIHPIAAQDCPMRARRPANSLLDTQKLRETFGLTLPDWREGVNDILDRLPRT